MKDVILMVYSCQAGAWPSILANNPFLLGSTTNAWVFANAGINYSIFMGENLLRGCKQNERPEALPQRNSCFWLKFCRCGY